jgi:hypothetical protein
VSLAVGLRRAEGIVTKKRGSDLSVRFRGERVQGRALEAVLKFAVKRCGSIARFVHLPFGHESVDSEALALLGELARGVALSMAVQCGNRVAWVAALQCRARTLEEESLGREIPVIATLWSYRGAGSRRLRCGGERHERQRVDAAHGDAVGWSFGSRGGPNRSLARGHPLDSSHRRRTRPHDVEARVRCDADHESGRE